ncbi:MAG TPA: hypothetical protein VK723_00440 [Thermoplasmata archaeon]|nr:hypothetical protein [Thermoplasmata archaeon]
MTTRGKVTEEDWREKDRWRALLICALAGGVAAIVTVVLYLF